jgi:fructokinase
MQIGIDVGATKIESVVLEDNGLEQYRSRTPCPKEYDQIVKTVKEINDSLEKKLNKILPIGVCHPGIHSQQTGFVKNAPNCYWLEKKPFQQDLSKLLNKEVFCENDANCFALSEAIDGAGKNYKVVYGIILGSGVGGGLVMDKKIVSGPNGVAGEWGHNQLPFIAATKEGLKSKVYRDCEVESFISGLSLAKRFNMKFNKNFKTKEIFELYRKNNLDAVKLINEFKINLAMSLSTIINILDPDAFVFGGGVSNEIDFLNEIHSYASEYVTGREYKGIFLKPKYGDASGVRGAARLGRTSGL